jgi:hypothetical protein
MFTILPVYQFTICQETNIRNLIIKVHHGALSIADDTPLFFTKKERKLAITNASNYILATNGWDAEMILPNQCCDTKIVHLQGINVMNFIIKVHHGVLSETNDTPLFFTKKQRKLAVTNASNYILATNGWDAEMIPPYWCCGTKIAHLPGNQY